MKKYKNIAEIELPGVYLLWRNNKVIYVGQSNYLIRRINNHNHANFDLFSFEIIEDNEKRALKEQELIKRYSPMLNKIDLKQKISTLGTYKHRKHRLECVRQLVRKYGIANLSSRKLQKLLKAEFGIEVNHNTANKDLHYIQDS